MRIEVIKEKKVDINVADLEHLKVIGFNSGQAEQIIIARQQAPITHYHQLKQIHSVGQSTVQKVKAYLII